MSGPIIHCEEMPIAIIYVIVTTEKHLVLNKFRSDVYAFGVLVCVLL